MSASCLNGSTSSNGNGSDRTDKRTFELSSRSESRAGLVRFLEDELKVECEEADRQRQLYSTLLREYEVTRQQLAEARLHIDRLRFGAHVDVYKHYIITHSLVPRNSSLPQRIAAILQRGNPDLQSPAELSARDSCSESVDRANSVAKLPNYLVAEMERQTSPKIAELVQKIYSLQQHVLDVEGAIDSDISFEELRQRLSQVQEQHRDLSKSVTNLLSDSDEEMGVEVRNVIQEEVSDRMQSANAGMQHK